MVHARRMVMGSVLAVALLAAACSGPSWEPSSKVVGGPTVVLDDATRATLQEVFERSFAQTGMPGATAYVSIGGDVWTATLGVDDLSTNEPFPADGTVRIASVTKSFTATAILEAVDQGRLSLDDTLEQFVPGIANGDQITVRDLLSMTSGVWDFTSDDAVVAAFDADPMMAWTPERTVEAIREHPAEFSPGEKVVYCDSNYVLLGLVLEQVTGMTAAEAITTMVVEPLRMSGTRFPADDEPGVPAPAITGYQPGPGSDFSRLTPVGDIDPRFAWTAGAMTSNVEDLVLWAHELSDGSLLDPATQAARLDSRRFDGQKVDVGYGLGVTTLNDLVGHDGAILGYSTAVFRYPQADATFVVVGNGSNNFTTPTMDIFLSFVQALYPDQLR